MNTTTQTPTPAPQSTLTSRYGQIGIVAVAAALMFAGTANAASAPGQGAHVKLQPVPVAIQPFVHPLDRVGFNPQPEPPAPLLLPAVQRAR